MTRYVRDDEFIDIARDGAAITITTGKLGTEGTTAVEQLATPALASTRWNVLLNQQGRAGWKLYKAPVEVVEPVAPVAAQAVVYDARNVDLERAITDDPDNLQLYEVYGAWLQGQGDPRGKVVALEIATRGKPFGDANHAKLDRFTDLHREYLYGAFTKARGRDLSLRLGFVWQIEMLHGRYASALSKLLKSPSCRFVTTIHLDVETGNDADADLAKSISAIAEYAPASLRSVELGGQAELEDISALAKRLPDLHTFALTNIADRELGVAPSVLRTITASPWPRLKRLTLELLRGACRADTVVPLFARTDLPKLTELTLRTMFDDDLVASLVRSPLAGQLEMLTIEAPGGQHGGVGSADRMAQTLLTHRDRFRSLRVVHVPVSRISPAIREALTATFVGIRDHDRARRYEHNVE